jgi:hypothetical protein
MVNPERVIHPVAASFSSVVAESVFDCPLRKEGQVTTMAESTLPSVLTGRPTALHNSLHDDRPSASPLFWLPPRATAAFRESPIPCPSNIEIGVKHLDSRSNI